jgi:chromate reductase
MTKTLNIAVFCGSLRKNSTNAAVVRALPGLAPAQMSFTNLTGLDSLPHYDADIQEAGFPAHVINLADQIRAADGVAFVTPEYNYSVPGFLKNALDWLSRLNPQPFVGKPVVIQSASSGLFGGVRAQHHLRQILVFLDALPMNQPEMMIGGAASKVSEDLILADQQTRDFVAAQLGAFAKFIERVS